MKRACIQASRASSVLVERGRCTHLHPFGTLCAPSEAFEGETSARFARAIGSFFSFAFLKRESRWREYEQEMEQGDLQREMATKAKARCERTLRLILQVRQPSFPLVRFSLASAAAVAESVDDDFWGCLR